MATFGPRFGAWLLDLLFSTIIAAVAGGIVAVVIGALVAAGQSDPATFAQAAQQDQDLGNALLIGFYIGYLPLYFGYHWISAALGGGWGKRIVGLRLVNAVTGEAPGWGSGLARVVVSIFSGFFYLGYLWALWDDDLQTWHDKAADTIVVHAR